jgi:hypothetical protein
VKEVSPCIYHIQVFSKQACEYKTPAGSIVTSINPFFSFSGFWGYIVALISFVVWVFYYSLVVFVLFSIFKIVQTKMGNSNANILIDLPFRARVVYYYNRVKHAIVG